MTDFVHLDLRLLHIRGSMTQRRAGEAFGAGQQELICLGLATSSNIGATSQQPQL